MIPRKVEKQKSFCMNKTLKVVTAVALAVSVLSPLATLAQTGITTTAPISSLSGVQTSLESIVNWIIVVFWILTVLFLVWAAILYLTGAGNEEKIKEAKSRVIYAIIAAAIALLSTGLQGIVSSLLRGQTQ